MNPEAFKIIALREHFAHMGNVSGYDVLYQHFGQKAQTTSIFCNFKKIYPRGVGRLLQSAAGSISNSSFYNAQSLEAEAKLLIKTTTGNYNLVHYTHGEPYFNLGAMLSSKKPVVITNHQPVSWWKQNESALKKQAKATAIIALSEYDAAFFNEHLPGKAVCIPHGVDTNFFKPNDSEDSDTFNVVFAGRYLRDMKTLAAVVKTMSKESEHFHFDIVYPSVSFNDDPLLSDLAFLKNVRWHSDISDKALLKIYQQADCCLIPLLDCTANNAILEAMACGLPIVSTDLPSIATYLDDSMSYRTKPGGVQQICDALKVLQQNPEKRKTMGKQARKKAETLFDWDIIATQTLTYFKSL